MKKKSIAVFGMGRFGSCVAQTLYKQGHEVLVVDKNDEGVQNILPFVTHGISGDITDENLIRSLGIRNFDAVVVAIGGNIQASILVTLILKEAGVKYILAKAQNELHEKVLYKVGADRVIIPEKDMGFRVAQNLISKNILDYIEISNEHSIIEVITPKIWINKSLKQINVKAKYGVYIMAIKNNNNIKISPKADYILKEEDILVIIGLNGDIMKVTKLD
jgi:trk system potassium uptake protein TrkA